MRYAIIDTETTGLGPTAKAVEMAWVIIDDDLNILEEFESLVDPEIPIQPGAQAIHGISAEMVADAPTLDELINEVLDGPYRGPTTVIAHRVVFDRPFFEPLFEITNTFCTLGYARKHFPRMPNHKLGTVKEFFGLAGGTAHRALGDVHTVHQFLCKVIPESGRPLSVHCGVQRQVIFDMPYGKHKGEALFRLPPEYRTWLLSSDIDPDLRFSLMQLRTAGI